MGCTFDPFYSAQYCTMLSDSASCCTAEIGACLQQRNGAILLCSLLGDAFPFCKQLLIWSKDCCNIYTVPTDWYFQIVQAAAASLQQRLVQYYSVEYWVMLSDSLPSCCIFVAKIGAMLLCWVPGDAFRFCTAAWLQQRWCNMPQLIIGWCS